jgi:hypothetical protein
MGDIASRITGVSAAGTGTAAAGLAQQRRAEPPMSGGDYAPSSGECAAGRPGDPGAGRADEQRERGHIAQRNAHGDADQGARASGEPDRRRRRHAAAARALRTPRRSRRVWRIPHPGPLCANACNSMIYSELRRTGASGRGSSALTFVSHCLGGAAILAS